MKVISRHLSNERRGLAKLLMLVLAGSYSCKTEQKKTDQGSAALSWFNRTPDTMLTIPVTNETIDTHRYRMDQATRDKVKSLRSDAVVNAANVALQRLNSLDFTEAAAIQAYTEMDFKAFSYLFAPDDTPGVRLFKTKSTVLLFKSAISAINGMQRFQGKLFFGQAMPKAYVLGDLKKGEIFSNNNFLSTSKDRKIAEKFARKVNAKNDTSVLFEIQSSCHGRDISSFSEFPHEKEVLFSPLHPFKILDDAAAVPGKENYFVVKLQEILPCTGPVTQAENDFPYCRTKQLPAKIYGDAHSSKVIGNFRPQTLLTAFAKVNTRYAVFSDVVLDSEAQKCVDSNCLRTVTNLQGLRPSLIASMGEMTGIPVSDSSHLKAWNKEQPIGVVVADTKLTKSGPSSGTNKPDSKVVLEGFVEERDIESCSSELPRS
jgi:hypothetical protein